MSLGKDFDQIEEKNKAERTLRFFLSIFIGLSLLLLFQALYSIFEFATDDSIPLVSCPKSYELNAPVILKSVSSSELTTDRWIRGFIGRYMKYQFPRTGEDAEKFFTYVKNHSTGSIKRKYQSYLKEMENIEKLINSGFYYKVYAKNSTEVRIRSIDNEENKRWIVEVDSYIVNMAGLDQVRTNPTLRYTVEAGKPTLTNPEGLYVVKSNMDEKVDYVSGREKENE